MPMLDMPIEQLKNYVGKGILPSDFNEYWKEQVSYVDQSIKVKSISISNSSVSLKYGETEKLKATISPSNATNKQITWTSSNPSLVSVDAYGTLTT